MPLDLPLDVSALPQPIQRVIGAAAPAPMRMMAARGAVPGLRPEQIVTVVALLAHGDLAHVEPAAQQAAQATLAKLPPPVLGAALSAPELPGAIVDLLTHLYPHDAATLEKLITHPNAPISTIERLAKTGSETTTELIAVNEERLLAHTSIIECLYMNKATRMSTADRILDLAVRNGKHLNIPAFKEASEAIAGELISAPDVEPTPDDILFREAQAVDAALEAHAHELVKEDEEGNEVVEEKALPLDQRLRAMTVSQKVRVAMLGGAAARSLLVRDKNKTVAASVIKSPMVQEGEIAAFAASRAVSEDVLRLIGSVGDWTKSHTVKFNLVGNPKTPVAISTRLLVHLRVDELKKLSKSKNVSGQIAKLAKQELAKKQPKQ
jgi:hypothetical protein